MENRGKWRKLVAKSSVVPQRPSRLRDDDDDVLYKYDFSEVWVNQGVGNGKAFLKEFNERVLSLYRQDWENNLRTKERFSVYSTFKSSMYLSMYLKELKHVKARNFLIRLSLGVSPLKTHKLPCRKDVTPVDFCLFFWLVFCLFF